MALLILALLQRIFLMSSLMLLLVWLIFFMVLIKLLPIDRKSGSAGMPETDLVCRLLLEKKKKRLTLEHARVHPTTGQKLPASRYAHRRRTDISGLTTRASDDEPHTYSAQLSPRALQQH